MKLPLACADFTFPLVSHDTALSLVSMLEFDGVDIGLFEKRSHLWPSEEFKRLASSAKQLKKKVGDRGIRVADIFIQLELDFIAYAINHPSAERRRNARSGFLKTLEYASNVESPHVTTLPGVYFDDEAREESWKRCAEELAWRVEQARSHGIVFGIEAHIGSIVPEPKAAKRLVESVPGLTLTLDYTHFARRGMPDSAVEPLIAHASHFHVRGARKGRLQTSFKNNTIDYRRVVQAMKKTGYKGYLGVEYVWTEWERCNEVDNLSETILFRDFLRKAMA